jgi:deoxycytidylate deaminase
MGLYCPRRIREQYLKSRGISDEEVTRLIDRDEHEPSESGQHLRDAFHLADVFVEVGQEADVVQERVARAFRVLFGTEIITPTPEEFGMFQAYAASLRSAQLGRQVGAAMLSRQGDVISVGTNEVPRFGGGSYWEGSNPGWTRPHEGAGLER